MAETLEAESRDSHGKRSTKRLRSGGKVPAVLYGHGQETVSLAVPAEQIRAAIRHGSRVVKLKGAANDSALIRDLQYDTYGLEILHIRCTCRHSNATALGVICPPGRSPGKSQCPGLSTRHQSRRISSNFGESIT